MNYEFNQYDVTIVGAGPVGSLLAYKLSQAGLKPLILEKEKLPRSKVCAGGVTYKASLLLPFDFSEVIEHTACGARLSYNVIPRRIRKYDKPLIYMVNREKFDYFLLRKACESGATLIDGASVRHVDVKEDYVEVQAGPLTFKTPILIGADGANSVVVRSLGWKNRFEYGIGVNGNITVPSPKCQEWDGLFGLDYGVGDGYAWVFPKSGHLSVGAGGSLRIAKKLKTYTRHIIRQYQMEPVGDPLIQGHLMPVRWSHSPLSCGRILLVGDAAGIIDPLTGEGLYYGFKSAYLASEAITGFLSGRNPLNQYDDMIKSQLGPELDAARKIQRLVRTTPWIYFQFLKDNDRVWRAFCRILRGEKTYIEVFNFLPRPLRALLNL